MRWVSWAVAFLFVSVAALSGCIGFSGPVSFTVIDEGGDTGFTDNDTQVRVAASEEEWQEFWRQHQANRMPPADRPAVNFTDDFVVGVFLGERPSGGHSLNVTQVLVENAAYQVHYQTVSPGQGCLSAAVLVHPYQIFTLPRESGVDTSVTLAFEGDQTYSCSEAIQHVVINDGGHNGFKDNQTTLRVLTSEDEWQEFWQQHQGDRSEPAARPAVDFDSHFVAAVFLGQRPSTGYDVNVTRVVLGGGEYRVHYESRSPDESCVTASIITFPNIMLTLPREDGVGTVVTLEFDGDMPYSC